MISRTNKLFERDKLFEGKNVQNRNSQLTGFYMRATLAFHGLNNLSPQQKYIGLYSTVEKFQLSLLCL